MRSPAFKYRLDPSTPAASGGTEISRSSSPASQTRSPVMIFVVLAIRLCSSAFFSYRTLPVCASTRIALLALTLPEKFAARAGRHRKTAATTAAAVLKKPYFIVITRRKLSQPGEFHAQKFIRCLPLLQDASA